MTATSRQASWGADLPPPVGLEAETPLADYFRDADHASDSSLAWQMEQKSAQIDAMRGLFYGPPGLVRLRLWVFLTLMGQAEATLTREQLDPLFHAIRPEALDLVLKRFRELGLLSWDETQRHHGITTLAQQVAAVLGPLSSDQDDELAGLLGQVVGADQLGTLDGRQVQMLQAQLGRLHGEFQDAIASGSEFRLREARKRYDRAARLIDRASDAISAIIGNARGQVALEKAARGLGQAQSRLLAMASQFNRALQQVDRQRVTLGTTGVTSTDVKRWLQTVTALDPLAEAAMARPVGLAVLAPHEMLDVTEAEFERDRPQASAPDPLPAAQIAPEGNLGTVALPQELAELSSLLAQWGLLAEGDSAGPHPLAEALLGSLGAPSRYAQVAYKAQLIPLLGDAQARGLAGATGDLARQPWRAEWGTELQALDHPAVSHLSQGLLHPMTPDPTNAP
ncbi:hypothetical protein [Polaromonas sp. SM01]|uniref:hypothetical protein n=1 Tax=Polaromonas sp. SM01 TaxID=3085630 RepID=UPI0029828202|nr:hypothetical protein [Polaromonas sp. SM01]MDW5441201.1 hypothetical protein [Polaromonas sp. SM01]